MKKLFILLIAISAFVLGISSCSNDLHDGGVDLSSPKCDIIGDMDNNTGTPIEGGKYSFVYSTGMNAWGGGNGIVNYKVRPNGAWDGSEVGGENIIAGTVPSHLEVGESGGNAVIKGLKDGGEYTLHFVSSGANLELSIEANDATPNYTYIEGFYLLSKEINGNDIGNAGKQVLVNGTQIGSDIIYTISYLPKTGQETIGFEISNADKSVRYRIDADDKNAKQVIPDSGEEVKLAMNPKNGKNVEIAKCLPMQAQVFITIRTTAVTTDAEGNTQGGDIYVSATTGDDITPAEILDATDLSGTINNWGSTSHVEGEPGVFEFAYSGDGSAEFKVRKNGDWSIAYGDPLIIGGELPEGVEIVSNNGDNAKITGLKDNQGYRWTFSVSDDDPEKIILNIEEITIKAYDFYNDADAIGDFDGDGIKLVNGSFTIIYKNNMSAWGGKNSICNFKIRKVAGTWGDSDFNYSRINENPKLPEGVTCEDAGGDDHNIKLSGLKENVKYKFTFKPNADLSKLTMIIEMIE